MALESLHKVIRYPLISEDSVNLIEKENKITFIVDRNANKTLIRRAVEELYEVKVESVNVCITPAGEKKAYVKLSRDVKAADLAVRLGIL